MALSMGNSIPSSLRLPLDESCHFEVMDMLSTISPDVLILARHMAPHLAFTQHQPAEPLPNACALS